MVFSAQSLYNLDISFRNNSFEMFPGTLKNVPMFLNFQQKCSVRTEQNKFCQNIEKMFCRNRTFPRTLAESNILTNMVLIEAYYTLVLKIFRGFFALVNSLVRSMTTTKLGSMTVTKSCYKSLISDHIPKYEKKSNLI